MWSHHSLLFCSSMNLAGALDIHRLTFSGTIQKTGLLTYPVSFRLSKGVNDFADHTNARQPNV